MFIDGIDRIGPGRIGRRGQDIGEHSSADDIGGMSAARAFGMIGVDHATRDGLERSFEKAGFV